MSLQDAGILVVGILVVGAALACFIYGLIDGG
jgi:hypothetical protein